MADMDLVVAIRKAILPIFEEMEKRNTAAINAVVDAIAGRLEKSRPIIKNEIQPKVQVPEIREVVVEIGNELEKHNAELLDQIGKITIAPVQKATLSMNDFRTHDQDESLGSTAYYGYVHPSGSWYIVQAQANEQRYAAGTSDYPAAWKNRRKLDYSYIDTALGKSL